MLKHDTRKNIHVSEADYEYVRQVAFDNRVTITKIVSLAINELPNILPKKGLKGRAKKV